MRAVLAFGCLVFTALVCVPAGVASYGVSTNASAPTLRVDAKGDAEVGWMQNGKRVTFIVPPRGVGYHGTLPGADISKAGGSSLPLAIVARKTADGTLWALQELQISGRPASLDLARWKGAPTQLALATDGKRLTGTVAFDGRPVTGSSPTLNGTQERVYVYLECFGCAAQPNGWSFLLGVHPKTDGSFAAALRPNWIGSKYRATVQGPNVDGQLAPDAQVVIDAGS
ncbi:MAG TPA: hypothetical protein VGN06_08360 [Gaiellaceae bacterium]